MNIDMHCHFIPEAVLDLPADADVYYIHVTRGPGGELLHHQEQRVTWFDRDQMYSIPRRLRDMDAQGIDVAAISVSPFGTVYDLEPQRAAEVCRIMNDEFAKTV